VKDPAFQCVDSRDFGRRTGKLEVVIPDAVGPEQESLASSVLYPEKQSGLVIDSDGPWVEHRRDIGKFRKGASYVESSDEWVLV